MTEISSGVRSALARPAVYELWSRIVGGDRSRRAVIDRYVRPRPGERVLDLGCGPGELVALLPREISYFGVDTSPQYIARARERFGDRAEFEIGDATKFRAAGRRFEVVLVFGVLHHVDDGEAEGLVSAARAVMADGGRLVTIDPVYAPGQSLVARAIIGRDRGQHVRDAEAYERLAATAFQAVHTTVRDDLLRIPYSHCILECSVPSPSQTA
jgi:SAM-dependent methyltransferase